jgi:hypothetical protein
MAPPTTNRNVHKRILIVILGFYNFGCGDPLVNGDFAGDATIHLAATVAVIVDRPERTRVGALWLGYSATRTPLAGIEPEVLPVSSVRFPPLFTFDVLAAPPSVGHYTTADARIVPCEARFARFILFDDVDGNGALAVDEQGRLAAPDRLLARASEHLLLFVSRLPEVRMLENGALDGALLTRWEDTSRGYHVVELDSSVPLPDFVGSIVSARTPIAFTAGTDGRVF